MTFKNKNVHKNNTLNNSQLSPLNKKKLVASLDEYQSYEFYQFHPPVAIIR